MNQLIYTPSLDPWHNLALEELLFDTHEGDGMCLYLWQNQNTVVIGRNQNAWKECRIEALEAEGGRLARRSSGGGAVFHDTGNLNFTFITTDEQYSTPRQLQVIINAVGKLGIKAEFTGRNDIVAENGAKFSGNAFRYSGNISMHHGTILIDADMSRLGKYLVPSPAKLKAKGVDSVRSRVINLKEIREDITVDMVKAAVMEAFREEYGEYEVISESDLDASALNEKIQRYSSWEWNKGGTPAFDLRLDTRFPWGGVELLLTLKKGVIETAAAYSDAMDEEFIIRLSRALEGVRLGRNALKDAVLALNHPCGEDVANWLYEAEI